MTLSRAQVTAWSAQLLHVLAPVALVAVALDFRLGWESVGVAVVAVYFWAIYKEFAFDLVFEEGETVRTSALDFATYLGGIGLSLVLAFLVLR